MNVDVAFELEKSRIDYRNYRYIELENGLRAILVSNLKPGEELPEDSLSDSELESNNSGSVDDVSSATEDDPIGDQEAKSAASLCIKGAVFLTHQKLRVYHIFWNIWCLWEAQNIQQRMISTLI
ncbi:unnamed protein product [Heterobilharzia americana]|nr:unnamed protein product [Heterobilharzia americana]